MKIKKALPFLAMVSTFCLSLESFSADAPAKAVESAGGVKMSLVPAGEFTMGSEKGAPDEKPLRKIKIDSFYMDEREVSQAEFSRLMKSNPSPESKPENPAERVRWGEAVRYCNLRSVEDGLKPCYDLDKMSCDFSVNGYRLPTEAEWEYACRAGSSSERFFGEELRSLQLYSFYKLNSGKRAHPCAKKRPNEWGLYDMYGNVWEWCEDWYSADAYKDSAPEAWRGPEKGSSKVIRGGCYSSPPEECRSSIRAKQEPAPADQCFPFPIGFRCVRPAR